ncbi:MAG: hypothetical protein KGJ84_10745 [Elusimicrobia bacterium]|nr:hypothetical protein [Elusimicrobiota bacterium]
MNRRGQASAEYMFLLCTVLMVAVMMGALISKYGQTLLDNVGDKILDAMITLAMPY